MDRKILKELIFNMTKQKKFGKFFKDLSLEFIKKTSFKMSFLKKYQCLYQSINNTRARCPSFDITIQSTSNALTLSLLDQPLCYFTPSNARQFYSSWESLWVGKV